MDYTEQIARLCQTNEYLKTGHRDDAVRSVLPILEVLNHEVFESTRTARYIQPKFKRLYMTQQDYWSVLVAQGIVNTSLESVIALGWNRAFDDDSERRTLLGSLVRLAKKYGNNDHQPDELAIRALAALATLAAGKLRKINGFDLILAVPSSGGSPNGLPITIARLIGERLHCQCEEPTSIRYVRKVRKMKDLERFDEKLAEIRGAMEADSSRFRDRRVLVIDDMLESGGTLRETARALRTAGAKEVHALTLSRTRKFAKDTMNRPCL